MAESEVRFVSRLDATSLLTSVAVYLSGASSVMRGSETTQSGLQTDRLMSEMVGNELPVWALFIRRGSMDWPESSATQW